LSDFSPNLKMNRDRIPRSLLREIFNPGTVEGVLGLTSGVA